MERIPSLEAKNRSDVQEIPLLLRKP